MIASGSNSISGHSCGSTTDSANWCCWRKLLGTWSGGGGMYESNSYILAASVSRAISCHSMQRCSLAAGRCEIACTGAGSAHMQGVFQAIDKHATGGDIALLYQKSQCYKDHFRIEGGLEKGCNECDGVARKSENSTSGWVQIHCCHGHGTPFLHCQPLLVELGIDWKSLRKGYQIKPSAGIV